MSMRANLQEIRIHGEMGRRFGRLHHVSLDSHSPAEAFAYLQSQFPGVSKYLATAGDRGIRFAVFVGKRNISDDELHHPAGRAPIRIAPVIMGSKNAGVFQVILGAVIIAASIVYGVYTQDWYHAYQGVWYGAAMVAGGVVQMLSPHPKGLSAKDSPENPPSYAFNGPVNTEAAGHPVPVKYGRGFVGSAVISASITAEDAYVPTSPGHGNMGAGGGCVTVEMFVSVERPDGTIEPVRAGDVKVGDVLIGADPVTLEPTKAKVVYSKAVIQPCVEVESIGGVRLHCSTSAPIPTPGGLLPSTQLNGRQVRERDDLGERWESLHALRNIGRRMVQHISISNGCFWAGLSPKAQMLHHNKQAAVVAGTGATT